MKDLTDISKRIRQMAAELGFMHCGFSQSKRLDEDARRLEQWLNKNYHGSMSYMANHFDMRVDPSKLVPGAKSVITLAHQLLSGNRPVGGGSSYIEICLWERLP